MSAVGGRQAQLPKTTPSTQGMAVGKQATMLLEKGNPGLRRATPDSEALASSDDETDHGMSSSMISNPTSNRAVRRTSWMSEIPSTRRKPSLTFGTPISPTTSHPATPPADSGAWPQPATQSAVSGGNRTQTSYPWGTGIWNEAKKDAPLRLQEVLASPTAVSQTNSSHFSDEYASPPIGRGTLGDGSIPFTIPLHPTPKTYRSQSYSVGQLEEDANGAPPPAAVGTRTVGRGRPGPQYSNLQHRSSRPSVLGDFGHDSGMLGRVREDEDDGDDASLEQRRWESRNARQVQLAKENTSYRGPDTSFKNRTMSAVSTASQGNMTRSLLYSSGLRETSDVLEDPEEYGSVTPTAHQAAYGRRLSEQYSDAGIPSGYSQLDNRNLENVRKAHWQTSLGFGGVPEVPQSRRHSFADIPTRHGSISSVDHQHQQALLNLSSRLAMEEQSEPAALYAEDTLNSSRGDIRKSLFSLNPDAAEFHPAIVENDLRREHLQIRAYAATYFSGEATYHRGNNRQVNQQPYGAPNVFNRNQHGAALARHDQPLYVVTFKAQRADVFYIQEDTGLEVKDGDLVIVEADRGTDLGTVAAAGVSWEDARAIKAQLSEEHYKWLMLFSRQGQSGAAGTPTTSSAPGMGGSAIGGMGPPGTHGLQEPQSGELKPKLIRRLAQNHEIQTLRDKEGNEAKAKRVCQQKVVEHRLTMEILDAEFQMDWKKLTFYYFADAYINFNSLVTDLFKIYKTRIWMSAINPDSFITPSAGLSLPSPVGAGPTNGANGRSSPADRRRQMGIPGPPAGYMNDHNDLGRNVMLGQNNGSRGLPPAAYGQMPIGYQPSMRTSAYPQSLHQGDPFISYVGNPYAAMDHMAAGYPLGNGANVGAGRSLQSPGDEWTGNFQGLSLGS